METGPRLKVSSNRLEKPGIEPGLSTTPQLLLNFFFWGGGGGGYALHLILIGIISGVEAIQGTEDRVSCSRIQYHHTMPMEGIEPQPIGQASSILPTELQCLKITWRKTTEPSLLQLHV